MGTFITLEMIAASEVSIQLMSPASGDTSITTLGQRLSMVSIQLMSPASGDSNLSDEALQHFLTFPFN